ncbi:trimeric intracellular cation channel family protein [Aliarcobacter butzleri]|uniref:Trimeric intracellular cation channel family protein n=1 Tax=Aliarcobacter butzleri TaxID=28197 RepID=A0AAP4PF23_9BACT|nr:MULTISPECIES: trimeric intracellular cation channel family protein [Arcobacteraceae]MCG3657040.1 trimeric intracellular cation channel family protein [Aliarcobacter butzleri]MCG3663761.1 trimeric intracellular cation channel family protein [Aliarcobacter butzleri]MCT7547870.1 trimeric intracellular cation channel family protein [Aliarcobacter butzleri]MCT7560361.1 trimeric intracellular cation channel family protein [Aliarcobacter butzleri]MCT7909970.1 trimeric intracellular cation channel 
MSAFEIADIIGIICFALSGFLMGVYNKLDILGVFIAAFLTAFGGGMIRDVLADRTPYVFTSNLPLILVISTVLIAMLFKLHKIDDLEGKWAFVISDAIGLVSFSIAGAIIAINSGFNFLSVLILAFITAVGGGTIRDILINKVPFILVSEFYASVALIVGIAVYILELFEIRNLFTLSIVFILGVALRIVAYYRKWHLPTLSKEN